MNQILTAMKKYIFLSLFTSLSLIGFSQVVALHGSSGQDYFYGSNAFVDAYNASLSGDTIYLPGGGFTSPTNFNKSLFIFGAGHYPDSTTATAKTNIIGNINLMDSADGFRIEGVDLTGSFTIVTDNTVNGVIIKYSRIQGGIVINSNVNGSSTNFSIINSVVIGAVNLSGVTNLGAFNSFFRNQISYSNGNLFQNNVFSYTYSGYLTRYTLAGDNNVIQNNIFLRGNEYISGISNQIYNNIFLGTDYAPYFGTSPIKSGNYYSVVQDSIFVNQTGSDFNYNHDYHLTNPVLYQGNDNTELGLYCGVHPYKEGAVPSNPHIQFENIAPTTDSNGFLNVEIKVKAQDQ